MARETRRSGAERFKYGICLNDECPKCKNKDVQQIPMRREFVCEECGKELRECPPPKKSGKKPLIAAIAVIALVGIVAGGIIAFSGGFCNKTEIGVGGATGGGQDPGGGTPTPPPFDLGYAKFIGPVAGGKPNGPGRMTFTSSHMIDSRDPKGRVAEAGDYVIGEWSQGKLVQGKWFGSDNNVKDSIIIDTVPPLDLGYAKFIGPVAGGKPNGTGRMTFTSSHMIDSRDPKGRVAEAGDYVIGKWSQGKLVQGKWFGSDNNVKGSIIIDTVPPPSPGGVNLGYAKFTGPVAGGKPNGTGRMTFTSSHMIDSRDPKGRVAEAGDYVIGEWSQGKLVQGKWFGSDNNVKGSIIIGL